MKNPHEVDMGTRLTVLSMLLLLALVALGTLAWMAYHAEVCTSEAHVADFCDPYLPNVPGKEGR